jgi:tripartite-type tricarboxylate transporter receptor subunit TctC
MTSILQIRRRQLLSGATVLGGLAGFGLPSKASTYPNHTINFLIPYGPGGGFDAYVREFSHLLQNSLTPHVYVEPINMPGASGREAIFTILQSPPDGYNISVINIPGIIESEYQKNTSSIDISKLTWIANLGREAYGLAVGTKSHITNVADLQRLSRQREVAFGSTGPGSTDYFATRVFAAAVGLRIKEVTGYTSSVDSAVAVARGEIDCVVHSLALLQQIAAAGLIRVIFTFQDKSSLPGVDDASTIHQPDLSKIYQWFPVVAPPGLPPEIAATLSNMLVNATKTPDAQRWAKTVRTSLYPLDQPQTWQMVQEQSSLVAKWKAVI